MTDQDSSVTLNANTTVGSKIATETKGTRNFQQVQMGQFDSALYDAFSRLRVSEPLTLSDSQQQYDKGRIYWEDLITGSASTTHLPNESSVNLNVTANAADKVIRQTREYFRYQPAKSLLIPMTAVFGAPISGLTRGYGYADDDNGIIFEQTATGVYQMTIRSKSTGSLVLDTAIQTAWNLDKMDGSGTDENPSGLTLDGAKEQIFTTDLQWLSAGRVRVGFQINGMTHYVHQFLHSNVTTGAYMTTANLPMRYEISTDGTNGGSFKTVCGAVISEGGFNHGNASLFTASNLDNVISITTRRPILSIRPKATFNSIVNRSTIMLDKYSAFSQSKQIMLELVYGGTLTGASFNSVNDDSMVEYDISSTVISGGIVVDAIGTDKKESQVQSSDERYPATLNIAGNHPTSPYSDCYTLVVTSLETATSCTGSLKWREHR